MALAAYNILVHRLFIVVLYFHYTTVHWNSWTHHTTPSSYSFAIHPSLAPFISHLLLPYSHIAIKARCVCVKLCSKEWPFSRKSRGAFHHSEWMPNEEALMWCWYQEGTPSWRTCLVIQVAYFLTRTFRLLQVIRLFMCVAKNTCCWLLAFPFSFMTELELSSIT